MDDLAFTAGAGGSIASTTSGKGQRTRERLLDAAYDAILKKGFGGTSIEELVEVTGITKSGFFYHFRDKGDLARQLLTRFLEEDDSVMDELTALAEQGADDPMQRFLVFLDQYAEMMDNMEELHPGCLVAAILYQEHAYDQELRGILQDATLRWRERFRRWFQAIELDYQPIVPIDLDTISDSFSALVEGAIVLSRALKDKQILGRQVRLFRQMVKTIYGVV